MFLYRRSLLSLTKPRTSINPLRCTAARFNSSSSSSSCRDKENQVKLSQTDDTTTTVNNNNEKQQQQQRLSFMPVINIPETELAHNAFFSLHRPLLGLSDKHERSFFSNRQEQEESPDDQLAKYMMTIQPFVPPPTPGAPQEEEQSKMSTHTEGDDETLVSIEFTSGDMGMEGEEGEDQYFFDNTELQQQQPSIPVFHMPESGDVVDYLTSIETKLKASNQKLELEELRLKKLEILNNLSGKTSSRRHVHNRLRRFQLKWRK